MRADDRAVILAAKEIVVDKNFVVACHDIRDIPAWDSRQTPLQTVVGAALADGAAASAVIVIVRGVEIECEGLAARVFADAAREIRDHESRRVCCRHGAWHYGQASICESRERHGDGRDGG